MSEPFTDADFSQALKQSRKIWRLETLPVYSADTESASYKRFLAGERGFIDSSMAKWAETIRSVTGTGCQWARVHVVPETLTQYLEYEIFVSYPVSTGAGIKTGIIVGSPDQVFSGLEWPKKDFWLFDDDVVVLMEYDQEGRPLGATKHTDPATLKQCLAVRQQAEALATPLAEYIKEKALQ